VLDQPRRMIDALAVHIDRRWEAAGHSTAVRAPGWAGGEGLRGSDAGHSSRIRTGDSARDAFSLDEEDGTASVPQASCLSRGGSTHRIDPEKRKGKDDHRPHRAKEIGEQTSLQSTSTELAPNGQQTSSRAHKAQRASPS